MIMYTIGHSTHPIDEFLALLDTYGIRQLVDVRTVPGSRHNPQFNQENLKKSLEDHGISYIYMKKLGGLRSKANYSTNKGWHNQSFRNYADYMQTNEFAEGIEELRQYEAAAPTAIMCAEAVPWRCHRSLISDALIARGDAVFDIMSLKSAPEHKMTRFAQVDGVSVTYPTDGE